MARLNSHRYAPLYSMYRTQHRRGFGVRLAGVFSRPVHGKAPVHHRVHTTWRRRTPPRLGVPTHARSASLFSFAYASHSLPPSSTSATPTCPPLVASSRPPPVRHRRPSATCGTHGLRRLRRLRPRRMTSSRFAFWHVWQPFWRVCWRGTCWRGTCWRGTMTAERKSAFSVPSVPHGSHRGRGGDWPSPVPAAHARRHHDGHELTWVPLTLRAERELPPRGACPGRWNVAAEQAGKSAPGSRWSPRPSKKTSKIVVVQPPMGRFDRSYDHVDGAKPIADVLLAVAGTCRTHCRCREPAGTYCAYFGRVG